MKKIIPIAGLSLMIASCASIDNALQTDANSNQTPPIIATSTAEQDAQKGLVTLRSHHSVQDTANKLKSLIKSKDMSLFTTVDHQKNAASVDLDMRPTQVVMFGSPKIGTPLMECQPTLAIDLPQKMLIREDEQGRVWLSYNNPDYLESRHNISKCDNDLSQVSKALNELGTAATAK